MRNYKHYDSAVRCVKEFMIHSLKQERTRKFLQLVEFAKRGVSEEAYAQGVEYIQELSAQIDICQSALDRGTLSE